MSWKPGPPSGHALGIDFGTSHTVAVARWPDGRARPLLVDGSPLLPSAVYADPGGDLVVGRDAVHCARLDPARFEPNPKRRIDDGDVLLGERGMPVIDLITAVFARIAEEWHRAAGGARPAVTLTCPATWGATRRTMLADAAAAAGLRDARLVAEPVAAATYFAEVLGRDVPIGSAVVVYDFGAGTFDASVVARTAEGFEVLAVDGRDDIGGLDVDAAVVEHLRRQYGERDEAAWQRLTAPASVEDRRAQRQLWDDVRVAKERLSRVQSADLVLPLLDLEVHLTRDELEGLAAPVLAQTVSVTEGVLQWVGLAPGRLAGVFLVGGASRIPLVATLLHRALGEPPVVIEQPELVVAEGSLLAEAALLASGAAAPGPTAEMRLPSALRALRLGDPDADPVTVALRPAAAEATARTAAPAAPQVRFAVGSAAPVSDSASDATVPSARMVPHVDADAPTVAAPKPGTASGVRADPPLAQTRMLPSRWAGSAPVSPAGRPAAPRRPSPPAVRVAVQPAPVRSRRPGVFVRTVRVLVILAVLVALPVAAAVLAYGIGSGKPPLEDMADLGRDIARLFDRFVW